MDFEEEIQDKLGVRSFKKVAGTSGGGCINQGQAYETDGGKLVFVKRCSKENACQVVEGEFASLAAIASTATVRVPEPIATVYAPDATSAVIVMEYLCMSSLKSQQVLGQQLAALHSHNELQQKQERDTSSKIGLYKNNQNPSYVTSFGFDATTCCGSIAMNNEWLDDWESFFARNRLADQMSLIEEKFSDREAIELWSKLQLVISKFFKQFHGTGEKIQPSLLHGDLWSGNAAEIESGPVIFDASSFYGHSEYDLAIAEMFGGFTRRFFSGYFGDTCLPSPQTEKRIQLYQLFHYLNHWNHFGSSYRDQSLNLMQRLIKMSHD